MGQGAWVDMGIFVQSVMLAALDRGLGSCAQASIADYPDVVRDVPGMANVMRFKVPGRPS
ncbi:MAG: nitroreductase family protein, partial [Acidiferrobacterales bacterium]